MLTKDTLKQAMLCMLVDNRLVCQANCLIIVKVNVTIWVFHLYYHLKTLQELEVLFSVKNWRNLFMPVSPAGWIIILVSSPAFQRRPLDSCSSSRRLLPFWQEPENLSTSHQSSGPYTGFQLHLGLISKVLLLVYVSLNGLGPKYIADMLTEYKPNRPLRSVGSSQLEIPRVHTKQRESAFSYFSACSWNQLPEEIRCAKTLATFKSRLKTHLFSCAFVEWALCYIQTDCTMYNHFLFLTVLNSFKCFIYLILFLLLGFFLFLVFIIIFYVYFTSFYVKHFE